MTVLILAEHEDGAPRAQVASVIAAARELDAGDVHVLVAGKDVGPVAEAVAAHEGVAKVLVADDGAYEHEIAENLAALVVANAEGHTHLLFPETANGKNVMPRVAALLDVAGISGVTEIKGEDTFVRPIYAGNALATVRSTDSVKVLSVRYTAFDPVAAEGGSAAIEQAATGSATDRVGFVGQALSESDRPELISADVVVSGGRGMQNGENFSMLDEIAGKLNAAVGASRAAVDAGFVPNEYQVGQTGKVVAPNLYLAIGISGAIQHLAGMKDSKVIVAINKDEEAPIFQVADYGLVADLFEALPELSAALDG